MLACGGKRRAGDQIFLLGQTAYCQDRLGDDCSRATSQTPFRLVEHHPRAPIQRRSQRPSKPFTSSAPPPLPGYPSDVASDDFSSSCPSVSSSALRGTSRNEEIWQAVCAECCKADA